MTSIRIPHKTLNALPPLSVFRFYWFRNNIAFFKSRKTIDDQWLGLDEVLGIWLKRNNWKLLESIQKARGTHLEDSSTTSAVLFSFSLNRPIGEELILAKWQSPSGWIPLPRSMCKPTRLGPSSALVACDALFLNELVDDQVVYFTIMQNATLIEL